MILKTGRHKLTLKNILIITITKLSAPLSPLLPLITKLFQLTITTKHQTKYFVLKMITLVFFVVLRSVQVNKTIAEVKY